MSDGYPAGWYPDPAGTPQVRYYDGQQWTNDVAAPLAASWAPPTAVVPVPQATIATAVVPQRRRGWWQRKRVLIPVGVLVVLGINAAKSPKPRQVTTASPTTIATQILAQAVTAPPSTTVPTTAPPTTTIPPTTIATTTTLAAPSTSAPATTIAPAPVPSTESPTAAATPVSVLPVAAPVEPPAETAPPTTLAPRPSVYFNNCAEARAAGVAPLRVGDPGYRSALDKDKDGIACE